MLYFGEYRATIDDKGRARVPNKIKAQFGSGAYVVCAGTNKTLFMMPEDEFSSKMTEIIEETPFCEFEKQNALRMFSSSVFVPDEDAQGRFVLPAKLRAYAGLGKRIVFLGATTRVEIWPEERYDANYGTDKLDIDGAMAALGI